MYLLKIPLLAAVGQIPSPGFLFKKIDLVTFKFQLSTQAVLFVMPPPPLTVPGLLILVVPAAAVIIEESLNSLI